MTARAPAAPDHRATLSDAVAALEPLPGGGYRWFGEPLPGGRGETLVRRLQMRLYLDYYGRGAAGPTLDRRVTPAGAGRADLEARLSAANAGSGCLEPGWRIERETGDGMVTSGRGLQLIVAPEDFVPEVRGRDAPGSPGFLRMPKELLARSPGFYMALGDRGLRPDEPRGRLYWSLTPEGAVSAMRAVTRRLNASMIPFAFKVLSDSSAFTRADAGVLYLARRDVVAALAHVREITEAIGSLLRDVTPALTQPVSPGVAYADDPADGESFGMHRCRLIAEGVAEAWSAGHSGVAATLAAVEARFRCAGLSLDAPHRSAADAGRVEAGPSQRPSRPARADPLEAALEIGRRLRETAIWDGDRCTWIAPEFEEPAGGRARMAVRPVRGSLGSGTAGVGLFLAELYAETGETGMRRVARGALRHALGASRSGPKAGGLHEGPAGVAFSSARASALLGAEELLDGARSLVRTRVAAGPEVDVMSGAAGTALALLGMPPELDDDVMPALEPLGRAILGRAEADDDTMSWATGTPDARLANLLGMAHGTSGIGLALAALASRTADTGLAEAARAAFAYERRWYDPDAGGWPDLRARSRTGAPGPALTMAWCHGAPGAGLARIHAARLLDDEDLRSETEVALDLTASWVRRSLDAESADFCLCHGLAGNAEILLEGARRLPGAPPSWADLAREAADVGIHRHPGRGRSWPLGPAGEAPSLLTGLAGVGLFLIRLVDARVRSVLVVGTERMTAGPRPGRRHPRSQEVLNAG